MSLLALIVDDEAPARAELRFLLERIEDVEVVGEAASVREALALAARLDYDVVFCDISMPELTGIDAAREIMSWPKRPHVVFVTAHQDYAVQAFSVDAFDYLLKPVAEDRLAQTVERLRSALRGAPERAALGELAKVPVSRRGETLLLDHDQVYFMLAEGDYARIATYDERYLSTQSLRELEDSLPPAIFFRIHRSSIVNLQKVTALEQSSPGPLDRAALGRRGDDARGRAAPDARAQAAPGTARVRRVAALAGVGGAAGLLSALFGVGGGIVIVPSLIARGWQAHRATATSLAAIGATAVFGTVRYAFDDLVVWHDAAADRPPGGRRRRVRHGAREARARAAPAAGVRVRHARRRRQAGLVSHVALAARARPHGRDARRPLRRRRRHRLRAGADARPRPLAAERRGDVARGHRSRRRRRLVPPAPRRVSSSGDRPA